MPALSCPILPPKSLQLQVFRQVTPSKKLKCLELAEANEKERIKSTLL
ncbi:hypothetical protein [Candidatus Protochlamydia sp. R18]|nr:hypothetical protein [Candidatus Protochlamydia sp. R18]